MMRFSNDTAGALGALDALKVLLLAQAQVDGLLDVDDVDLVSSREDVRSHLRAPVASALAEVDACFNEFLHQ